MTNAPLSKIFARWPSLGDFARDISVGYEAAKQMRRRQSIPVKYWPAMISSAAERGEPLTEAELVEAHVEAERSKSDNPPPFPAPGGAAAEPEKVAS
jgi:hypothetical protein